MVEIARGPTISCAFYDRPVAVIATYKGRLIPIEGATVTFFYSGVAEILVRELNIYTTLYIPAYTDLTGLAQACLGLGRYVQARIQKTGVNFGSGVGVQHIIGGVSGVERGISPYIFPLVEALTPPPLPPAPPCLGFMSYSMPNFTQILSSPTLPTSIPIPISLTGTSLPEIIPVAVLVDGREVTRVSFEEGLNSLDILSVIRSLGTAELNRGHSIVIRSLLTDCSIPQTSFNIPALIPAVPTCTPPQVYNPVTGRCETPAIPVCTPPQVYNPVTRRCETPVPVCTPPQVYNPVTGRCETPVVPVVAAPPPPPVELGKVAKILTYPEGAPLEAFDGMDMTIIASVVCGTSPSNGEQAVFTVDGNEVARGTTSSGVVSFTWKATVEPSRTHKLCVSVPKSSQCPQFGEARDCKTITVSRLIPGIGERLRLERQAYIGQLEAQRLERERIREISLALAPPTVPIYPTAPTFTVPTYELITAPTAPTAPAVTVPPAPEQVPGIIDIPSVKVPPGLPYPVEILIDGEFIGSPPVYREATPGTHTVTIRLKGFTPISEIVNVSPGQILTIEEGFI